LFAYLIIAQAQWDKPSLSGSYNVGPNYSDCVETGKLAELFCLAWGEGATWEHEATTGHHESGCLKLDCSKLSALFNCKPKWDIESAIIKTVEWVRAMQVDSFTACGCMDKQIREYIELW
jgi:CDP-glucose 4,6-dehydratase